VVQCDAANRNPNYPNVIVAAISGQGKAVPFHIALTPSPENGLKKESHVKCEQIMTCSKERLSRRWGRVGRADLARIEAGMRITLEL
jgi:mRNA interferase MazF